MPEPTPQIEQELAAAPIAASPAAVGAAPMGAFSAPMAASVRAFSSGRAGLPSGFNAGQVSALQRSAGNQAVARLVAPPLFIARQPAPAPAAGMAPPSPAPPQAGPAGPSAAPAGPQPAAVPAPNQPSAANPQSGINWDEFWAGNAPNVIRTFLEVARLYPGWGLLAGGAADLMNAKQDFTAIQGEDAPEIKAFMAGRHAVAILNNGLGHVIYVVELVQDIATASVVGAEVDAITIPLNEILLGIKVGVDSVQFLADFGLTCAAQYRSMKAPPGPAGAASRAAWDGMVANYEANLVGDLVGGIFDIIDLSSAGFSNAQPVKQGAKAVKATFDTAKLVKGLVKSVLQGWFGVWGGKAFERGAPGGGVHGLAERAAGGIILQELQAMKAMYTVGDMMIGAAADHIARQLTELNQAATIALGGRDPFITARDAAVEGLGHVEARIGDLAQMQALSTTAKEKTAAIETWCTDTSGKVNALQVPNIEIPEADIGDDALSDLAEGALNMAGDLAGAGLQLLVDQLNAGVDEMKGMLTPPIDTIKTHATDLGQFMQIVADEAREQIASTQARVAEIKGKLAKCNSFEDVVNLIIQQIFDMVGLETDFEIDDIRQLWADVGTMIDEGIAWATALASGTPQEPPPGTSVAADPQAGIEGGAAGAPGAPGAGGAGAANAGGAPGGGGGAGGGGAANAAAGGGGGGVPAGAAAAAAASPPSAPPSGAAAGHDIQQPGGAAAAAGAAGAGAPAVDPGAFGGAAAAGAAGAAGAAAAGAAGAAGAAAAGAAGAAGAAAAGAAGAAGTAAEGAEGGVLGGLGGGMGGMLDQMREMADNVEGTPESRLPGGGGGGGGLGGGMGGMFDKLREMADNVEGTPESRLPGGGGGGGLGGGMGGMFDKLREMADNVEGTPESRLPGGGGGGAEGGGAGGGMGGIAEMIRQAAEQTQGGGGGGSGGGGAEGGGAGGGMGGIAEMIRQAAEQTQGGGPAA